MLEETEVLVVGAGPVGLATACALSIHGVKCRVVDELAEPKPMFQSKALALWARTLEVFDDLGCVGKVLEQGLQTRAVNAYHGRKQLVRVRLDLEGAETPYPFVLDLPQGNTERILSERLGELGGGVERGLKLQSLEQRADSVRAILVDAQGSESSINAKWLVGCDGAHSAVRHALGLGFEGSAYPETFRLIDATIDWELEHSEAHMFLLSGGGGMAVFPLPGEQQWRLVDISDAVLSEGREAVKQRFRDLLTAEAPGAATLGETTWLSTFRIQRRIADRFRAGRCFVAGDAAHIHSPAGGQGMNTGIQDGHNLAWKLAMVIAGTADQALLESYESERRPVALEVLKKTDLTTRGVTMRNPIGRLVRNAVVPFVLGFSRIQKKLAWEQSELGIDYGVSGIVKEDVADSGPLVREARAQGMLVRPAPSRFTMGPRAGQRCPDVVIETRKDGGESRLFDFLEVTKHTLLLFASGATPEDEVPELAEFVGAIETEFGALIEPHVVIERPPTGETSRWPQRTILDADSRLRDRFGALAGSVYLIRPDGYVGYRRTVLDLEAFREYVMAAIGPRGS